MICSDKPVLRWIGCDGSRMSMLIGWWVTQQATAPTSSARYARAFVDPNRAAFELDPRLLPEPAPSFVETTSVKARAGLGTIPSRLGREMIYPAGLDLADVERRIAIGYWPYHEALRGLIDDMHRRFGMVILLDCHSMPSPLPYSANRQRDIDINLGDRFGQSCAPAIMGWAEEALQSQDSALHATGLTQAAISRAITAARPKVCTHFRSRYGAIST